MIRKLLLLVAGLVLTFLGLIGLVLPVLPGLLLLAAAAFCLSLASRRLRQRVDGYLARHRHFQRARRRWEAGRSLPVLQRLRLGFWLSLSALLPASPRHCVTWPATRPGTIHRTTSAGRPAAPGSASRNPQQSAITR